MVAILINEYFKITVKNSGAELVSIRNTITNVEYLWQGDPQYWGRRAPVLFPIVGMLKEHQYRAEGKNYKLPQHGFARDQMFDRIDHQDDVLTYQLKSNEETLKVYPYNFELTVKYKLDKNKLIISYDVKNTDERTIWFSIGAHPAFRCPMDNNEKFTDYYLEFEKPETVDRHGVINGLISSEARPFLKNEKIIDLTPGLFEKDAIIFKNLRSSMVSLKSRKSNHQITMDYAGFPYFAIWTKAGGAPFICLEPWFGIADSHDFTGEFKDKEAIRSLQKGKTFNAEYSLEMK